MGDINMKKVLSILFSASLILGLGTNAIAGEVKVEKEKQKAIELVNKTNEKIRKEIEKGVKKAEKLQADYYADVEKLQKKEVDLGSRTTVESVQDDNNIEEIDEIFSIIEEEVSQLAKNDDTSGEMVVISGKMATLISPEKPNCDNKEICKFKNGEPLYENYIKLTDKYTSELEEIITSVYYETKKMSDDTITKVSEVGYIGECSWVKVEFGHLIVWIDPIRIVGEI
jgi:polyribonucleotide nucleotidyltransferase